MGRVLITGANGFIGRALVTALAQTGADLRTAGRAPISGRRHFPLTTLDAATDWRPALADADTVIHLAGPAHARLSDEALHQSITEATATLAKQAEAAGVKQFVFVSSIKATTARTADEAVRESDPPTPEDGYGRAKLDAETAVLAHGALKAIVLRPPLVHAPNAKANFGKLLRLAWSGMPLPFAGIGNKRSLISRIALVEAIKVVLATPEGPGGVFHVAAAPALSTGQIIAALRKGMRKRSNLFHAPPLAKLAPRMLRESLEVNDDAFRAAYNYGHYANVSAQQALEACGASWRKRA
jgi:UDP-glucose 4-epimerase